MGMPLLEKPAVYGIRCKATGRWHVGASKTPRRRLKDHRRELRHDASFYKSKGDDYDFKYKGEMGRDFAIHGERSFEFVILEGVADVSRLQEVEARWVEYYGAATNGYNQQASGPNRFWV